LLPEPPRAPSWPEAITAAHVRAVIRATARRPHFMVVDTPSHLDERVLEAFELADRLLL